MTENKRFMISDDTECPVKEGKFELNREEVVDLLNKQDEYLNILREELELADKKNTSLEKRNKKIKQAYQTLKSRHSLLHDECLEAECDRDSLKKDVISLEKENEQLKNEIKMLKLTIARNEAYITRLTKKGRWTK